MALAYAETRAQIGGERTRVLQLVKAVSSGNWPLCARVLRGTATSPQEAGWTEAGLTALRLWIEDLLGDQEAYYSRDERYGLDHRLPHAVLLEAQRRAALSVRPSLAVSLAGMALMGH